MREKAGIGTPHSDPHDTVARVRAFGTTTNRPPMRPQHDRDARLLGFLSKLGVTIAGRMRGDMHRNRVEARVVTFGVTLDDLSVGRRWP
jgi:hypothetical protein